MTLPSLPNPFVIRHGPDDSPALRAMLLDEFVRRELSVKASALISAALVVGIALILQAYWLLGVVAVRAVSDVSTQPMLRRLRDQLARGEQDPESGLWRLWPRYLVVGIAWATVSYTAFLAPSVGPLQALLGIISVVAMVVLSTTLCFAPQLYTATAVGFVIGVIPMLPRLTGLTGLALLGAIALLLFMTSDIGGATARRHISVLKMQLERDRALAEQRQIIDALDEARRQATTLAGTDSVTQLPNRQAFLDHVDALTAQPDQPFALMLLDLDWFKNINDTMGHHVGDTVLVAVARALQARPGLFVAPLVTPMAARLGGDEFALVLPGVRDAALVERLHADLLTELERLDLPGVGSFATSATAGTALWPTDAADRRTLLNAADMALRLAKATDRGSHRCYERGMADVFTRETLIANLLVQSIDERLFVPFLQPQVDMADGRIVSAEALTRFTHPQLSTFPVQMVFDVAEERGLGPRLSATLLDIAFEMVMDLQLRLPHPLPVAINLSPSTMKRPEQLLRQLQQWRRAGLKPDHIKLELTEDAITGRGLQRIGQTMDAIAAMGFRIALDDFGTGQSSLSHLHSLPIHEIKIAKTFVDHVCEEPRDQAIVRSALTICEQLGIVSVVEGVETEAQADMLRAMGGSLGQGYLWHRPMPMADLLTLLRREGHASPAGVAFRLERPESVWG